MPGAVLLRARQVEMKEGGIRRWDGEKNLSLTSNTGGKNNEIPVKA